MKKLLFGITNLGIGGAERVLVDLVNNLSSYYDIEIFTIYNGGIFEKELNSNIKISSLLDKSFEELNIFKRKMISLKLFLGFYKNKINDKLEDKDTIIAFLEGPITKIFSNVKKYKVAWIHTDLTKHYSKNKLKEYKKNYMNYDKIIFPSNFIKEKFDKEFKNIFLKKELVIENYINEERILNKTKEFIDFKYKSPNFLVIGRFVKAKGYERLLSVHEKLITEGLIHYIYVIGEGPLKNEISDLIKEKKLDKTFILLGAKENPYPYLKNAEVLLSASFYEGFGMTALEAKILGKKVISTNTAVSEVLEDYENKVICENDENGLYNSLKEHLMNENDVKKPYVYNNKIIEKIKKIL